MDLDLARIFVKVVQHRSFSRAAAALKLPKSTVSKGVSRLERETATRLLLRTTRSLTLTGAGEAFYAAAAPAVLAIEEARKALEGRDQVLAGKVKITAPDDFGGDLVAPVLGQVLKEHPGLSFEVIFSGDVLDLVKEGIDLAVRIGRLEATNFRAKKVGQIGMITVAAPSYPGLRRIREPKSLSAADVISYSARPLEGTWTLRKGRQVAHVKVPSRLTANQMASLQQLTLDGAGVALLPDYLCREALTNGALVRVLPGWSGPLLPVHLLMPEGAQSSVRLKLVAERLEAALKKSLLNQEP